jgi:predicted AAA+ superfamily ATPase
MLAGLGKCYVEKIRTRSSSPKLQVYNTGLMNALRPEFFKQAYMDPALWGRITESAIGAHLLNYSRIGAYHLEYWRDRNEEVDFVLRKGDKIIGLEVKSNVIPKTKGMYLFAKKFNSAKVLMVGDSGIPTKEFLKMNPAMLFD